MLEANEKNRKCALYVRVSTSMQSEDGESLDEQIYKLKNQCKLRDWHTYEIYREEGFSGKNLKRPEFQRMLEDIKKGKINTVIVKKLDRLSRSILDFENVFNTFNEMGVDLITVQEQFDSSTPIGRAALRIVLTFAQLEREQTSERTIDVMSYRAKKGMFNGGYPQIGYDIDYINNCLVVNEAEVPIANEIFTTYLMLGSLSETAKYLNDKGYRLKSWTTSSGTNKGGSAFQKTNLDRILKNVTYIGKIKFNGQIYDGLHKGIISQEIFDDVQDMLNANNISKTKYRQNDNSFYLKGLLKCGSCHTAMTPSHSNSKGKKYFYYRCMVNNDQSKKNCLIGSVQARKVEELVVDELKFLSSNSQIIENIVEIATKNQHERVNGLAKKKKYLSDRLAHANAKAKNILNAFGIDGDKPDQNRYIRNELNELETLSIQIEREIESIDFEITNLKDKMLSAELIRDNFKVFKDVYDHLTAAEKYDLIHLLVKKVEYSEEKEKDKCGKKMGKIKMDLWEIPPIDPPLSSSTKSFAERNDWLPKTEEVGQWDESVNL